MAWCRLQNEDGAETKGKRLKDKALGTVLAISYIKCVQTQDQHRFTISEVAADCHELIIPRCLMRPSSARNIISYEQINKWVRKRNGGFKSVRMNAFLSDTTVNTSATSTEEAVDRSGWTMSPAVGVKRTSPSVDMPDGETTTAVTPRTSQYRALLTTQRNTQVRNFTIIVVVRSEISVEELVKDRRLSAPLWIRSPHLLESQVVLCPILGLPSLVSW